MECYTCKEEMKCYDDICQETVRIDWYKCPRCNSVAQVRLDPNKYFPIEVIWSREERKNEKDR